MLARSMLVLSSKVAGRVVLLIAVSDTILIYITGSIIVLLSKTAVAGSDSLGV